MASAAVLSTYAAATSVLLSTCCECGVVYGVPRKVERRFAGVSHGYCKKHFDAAMAALKTGR